MNNNKAFALEQTQRQTQTSVARSMTNEELAIQIQLGKGEYYAELWQNCRKLLFKIMQSKLCGVPLPVYISREDLEQEMYFALCKAAQAYDDTKPYSFTSYLNYSVINTLHGILRRSAGREVSYNQTVGEDGETELCEFIEDETAAAKYRVPQKPEKPTSYWATLKTATCPRCKYDVLYGIPKFCSHCGQALDWS